MRFREVPVVAAARRGGRGRSMLGSLQTRKVGSSQPEQWLEATPGDGARGGHSCGMRRLELEEAASMWSAGGEGQATCVGVG
jgi:hypothetical protein